MFNTILDDEPVVCSTETHNTISLPKTQSSISVGLGCAEKRAVKRTGLRVAKPTV
jgi:hypothetical protein